jgi:hypothetical protein
MYRNEVEGINNVSHTLIFAAEKYELEGLKEICIESMIGSLSPNIVVSYLLISNRISNAEKLFFVCTEVIMK